MAKIKCKGTPAHVYVMKSADSFIKVGISENIVKRTYTETFEGEKKKIVAICYSAEKIDRKMAKIYEAALLGFHRKYIINGSEWLATRWENVIETLNSIFDNKTLKIQISENENGYALNDQYMKNRGYIMRYVATNSRYHYLRCKDGICELAVQVTIGAEEKIICSLSTQEMDCYLEKERMQLVRYL